MGKRVFHHAKHFSVRALAAGMALVAFVQVRATAAPGDIISTAAPALSADQPKATLLNTGDASVSTQTGDLEYSYPIHVPPGRHGMQPSLSLTYSSQAPIYGTVASGWSIPIPLIGIDTTNGRLAGSKTFSSSMGGGRPLVQVTETTLPTGFDVSYRAQNDASFTRYLHRTHPIGTTVPYPWLAQTTDGVTYYFGQSDHTTCTNISEDYAPLTSMVDAFGNAVDYTYVTGDVPGECRLSRISWGENSAGTPPLSEFARVDFVYARPALPPCNGIAVGSQTSYRSGVKIVTGASQLSSLSIIAFPPGSPASVVHTRMISLGYSGVNTPYANSDADCAGKHAAFRSLVSIQESAWGAGSPPDAPRVDLPAVTFAYGAPLTYPAPASEAVPWHSTTWGGLALYTALSWGQRFNTTTDWPTVEAMLVDVDGDGLLDRVTNSSYDQVTGIATSCSASWERNLGPGNQFAAAVPIKLPTLKWGSSTSNVYGGGGYANQNDPTLAERCALNYQQTRYVNSHPASDMTCPATGGGACPNPLGYCPGTYGSDCLQKTGSSPTILAYRWIDIDDDGKVDLVASVAKGGLGAYNLQWGNGAPGQIPPAPQEPSLFGAFPSCPAAPYSDGSASPSAYTMCNGMYPWFIYKNKGGGNFGVIQGTAVIPDQILYQPVALETTTGDSAINGRVVGNYNGNLDLDGDGHNDEVDSGTSSWSVFRGTIFGTTLPYQPAASFVTGPADSLVSLSSTVVYGPSQPINTAGLFDLNGDGLQDHWSWTSGTNANVEFNDGVSFIQTPVPARRPGNDGLALSAGCTDVHGFAGSCTRYDSSRTIDVDGDGRGDLVQLPGTCSSNSLQACVTDADCGTGYTCLNAATTVPNVYFNEGGQFSSTAVHQGDTSGLHHQMGISSALTLGQFPQNPYSWAIHSDMVDLDGDGIPEGVTDLSQENGFWSVSRITTPKTPPRLLSSIDNGRGATTSITYAALSNQAVVTQDPTNGKVSPVTQWVVNTISTRDSTDSPATTSASSTVYKNPIYNNLQNQARYGFRGFEETTTTGPTGAKTVSRYDYTVDPRGAHSQTLVYSAETPGSPTSIDTTTWVSKTLFGVLQTFHATAQDHLVCAPGQTEIACTPAAAAGFSRTTTTLSACRTTSSGGVCDVTTAPASDSLMWLATRTLSQIGTTTADGDRRSSSAFNIYAPPGTLTYRATPATSISEVQTGGVFTLFGKTAKTWDPAFLTPLTDEVWVDGVDANRMVTRLAYDMATGNITARWKPKQNDASGPAMTYDYDARKLFVVADHSEPAGYYNISQEVDYVYEYGTGTKLETKGPNIAPCSGPPPYTSPTCPPNTSFMQDNRIRVDGLGRTIDRWETYGNAGASSYLTFERARATYVDGVSSSVTTCVGYDFDPVSLAVKFTQGRVDLDGHGRTIKATTYASNITCAPPNPGGGDAITTFTYNDAGMLTTVSVPDPTVTTNAMVPYSYTYDSLGRPLTIRRPDSTIASNQSGANLTYSGTSATSQEVLGSAGGQIAITTSTKDVFGRLTKVEETVVGTTKAATTYGYDAANNVVSVVDPTGVTTTMSHDFAGRRLQISRAGSTWKYAYDKNGNMWSETFPGSTPATLGDYVTTTTYDNLDRPNGRAIGQRGLGASDIAAFGAGFESLLWDLGSNGVGQLGFVYSYTPTGTSPVTTSQYTHDLAGHEQNTIEAFSGLPGRTQTYIQHQTLLGNIQDTYYGDYPALDRATWSNVHYDARGLPSYVELSLSTSTPTMSVAQQTRNVAGLVTKRHTDTVGTMTFAESNWTYDKLGRVASQIVQKGPGTTQVARQDLAYFGNDNPKTLDQYLGASNHKRFTYGYDLRHEITSVGETLLPNAFTATYAYNSAGRFTNAIETAAALPNSDVKPRNVAYHYNGADPEQVTTLVNTNSTIAWAYAYDAAGNQTMRCAGQIVSGSCTGTSETDYVYDGNDRLRRVTQKTGAATQGSEEYWYDGHGNRYIIAKKNSAGAKTETIWFLGGTETHFDSSDNWVHSYANVSMGTPVARVDTGSSLIGKVEYQFHGLANNTLATIDQSTGTINTSLTYAPFGEVVEATNAGAASGLSAHRQRLNDKYLDEISDLYYYGVRFYDKTSISWTQADPFYRLVADAAQSGSPRMASLYQFSLENPLRYIDPDGRSVSMPEDPAQLAMEGEAANQAEESSTDYETDSNTTHRKSVMGRHHAEDDIAAGIPQARARNMHGVPPDIHQTFEAGDEGKPGQEEAIEAATPEAEASRGMTVSQEEETPAEHLRSTKLLEARYVWPTLGNGATLPDPVDPDGVEGFDTKWLDEGAPTSVYIGIRDGKVCYCGITNNMARRALEHEDRFAIEEITERTVPRHMARAIEQAVIARLRGFLDNEINSISPSRPIYNMAVRAGTAWLNAAANAALQ